MHIRLAEKNIKQIGFVISTVLTACLLSSCQSLLITHGRPAWYGTDEANQHYDPATDTRLRLYGQNHLATVAYANTQRHPSSDANMMEVGASLRDTGQSFLGKTRNVSIGIPATAYRQALATHDQLLSKRFYREWAVAGNQPITVQLLGNIVHVLFEFSHILSNSHIGSTA